MIFTIAGEFAMENISEVKSATSYNKILKKFFFVTTQKNITNGRTFICMYISKYINIKTKYVKLNYINVIIDN